jgi:Cof subfamily protein (haloacid dehalogenase superfamily)
MNLWCIVPGTPQNIKLDKYCIGYTWLNMTKYLPGPSDDIEALRPFAAIKLIVADLDGTLLPSAFAGKAERLLRQLDRAGVQMTVATGRAFTGIQELLSRLHSPSGRPLIKRGMPLILYNGSVVVEAGTGRLFDRKTMNWEAVISVIDVAAKHPCELFAYVCSEDLMGRDDTERVHERVLGWQFGVLGNATTATEFNGLAVEWETAMPLDKAEPSAVVIKSSESQVLDTIASKLRLLKTVSVTQSTPLYLEIRPEGSNKALALAWAAQRLKLLPAQVLTVGDSDNDVEMLKWAGIGVAVKTASKAARQQADFLCDYGPFQGVVQVLSLVHAAHRYFRNSPEGNLSLT